MNRYHYWQRQSCHSGLVLVLWLVLATVAAMSSTPPVDTSRFVYGTDDALFGSIETRQGMKPFGRVLDAGTGLHSLRWLATLDTMEHCVAVTADATMQTNCQREVRALGVADKFTIIQGNWFPNPHNPDQTDLDLIQEDDEKFDVILADYLIGAMDGFSPFMQQHMIRKLCRYLKPKGGRLYLVGLQPLPDSVPQNPAANIICRVRQVRDACILLAGHRCYREYPLAWICAQIQDCHNNNSDSDGRLQLVHSSTFPIMYSHETVLKQINVGRSKLPIIRRNNPTLADGLASELQSLDDDFRRAFEKQGKIELGFDYVVTAEWT